MRVHAVTLGLSQAWKALTQAAIAQRSDHVLPVAAVAGSAGYGFWYRLLHTPEGPSYTTSSCPKFTPLASFLNNVASSNMFYGELLLLLPWGTVHSVCCALCVRVRVVGI